jgi:hypothetical protein
MTLESMNTVLDLIDEEPAVTVYAYDNVVNGKALFAGFLPGAPCDIYSSPFVRNVRQIYDGIAWLIPIPSRT